MVCWRIVFFNSEGRIQSISDLVAELRTSHGMSDGGWREAEVGESDDRICRVSTLSSVEGWVILGGRGGGGGGLKSR